MSSSAEGTFFLSCLHALPLVFSSTSPPKALKKTSRGVDNVWLLTFGVKAVLN